MKLNICIGLLVAIIILLLAYRAPEAPIKFNYEKHEYIYFPSKGIVHSPECKQCYVNMGTI